MRAFEKTKGAISLFLVIILVPMMTLSGLFVDASKVNLARTMAESAGDLTLNTALTNYDTDLKELYGLMATAQDTSDLFEKLEDYYKTCITSSGVSEEDAVTYVEQIMAQLGIVSESNDTADIMNMQVVDFAVQKYPNAHLANATILKKQIVDFMKYRAPINTGLSFISSLKSFSTLSKQTELVEKKQAYYEKQQGVMENLKDAWQEIANYNNTDIVKTSDYLNTVKAKLNNIKDGTGNDSFFSYKQIHEWLVMDLYHVSPYIDYSCVINGDNRSYSVTWNGVNKDNVKDSQGYNRDLPSTANIADAVTHLKGAVSAAQETYGQLITTQGSPYYNLQLLVQQRRNNQVLDIYTNRMIEVHSWYLTLAELYNNLDEYDNKILEKIELQGNKETQKGNLETELESLEDNEENAERISELQTQIGQLETEITALETEIDNMPETQEVKATPITVNGESKTIQAWYETMGATYDSEMRNHFKSVADTYSSISTNAKEGKYNLHLGRVSDSVAAIANEVNTYIASLETSSIKLNNAITKLNAAKTLLEGDVARAKTAWSTVADDETIAGTSLAKQDQAEIAQLDTYLTADNIQKLVNRLTNIKEKVNNAIEQIKSYKYCGTFIGEITSYDKVEDAIEGKYGRATLEGVPITETELRGQVGNWWNDCWTDGALTTDWVNQSGKQPDLTKDKVSMYSYLYSHFAAIVVPEGETRATNNATTSTEVATESPANGKDYYKDIKETAKDETDDEISGIDSGQANSATAEKNISALQNLPSENARDSRETPKGQVSTETDNAAKHASSSLGKLFSADILSGIASMATGLRDRLYVADYAMSMFTYDTIEKEYLKKNPDVTSIDNGMLLSLTKNDLSAANNYAYGSEVEYIIYGGTNSSNLKDVYGSIYGIRFGFNLIYAFATSEIRDSALAIATPISAATLGIIPVPLIQAAIIIAIACCESGVDLKELKDGEKVPLYKTPQTWTCSVTGLTRKAKNMAAEVIQDNVDEAVNIGLDKLNELLDMTSEELTESIDDVTNDITVSITETYNQLITENANLAIQRLTMLINAGIEKTRCRELEETYEAKKADSIVWVKQELQAWGNEQTGDSLAAKVKREAVNVIIANSDVLINGLFDKMENSLQGSNPEAVINSTLNVGNTATELGGEIMEYIKEIRGQIVSGVINCSDEITRYKDEAIIKVKDAAEQGAEELKGALNDYVGGICGDSTTGDESIGKASLFTFAYSDYLRLFVLIGLYTNEEMVVLRIGDVVQANIVNCVKAGDDSASSYQLKYSATYVNVSAEIQVKPVFLALPLFADVENNPVNDASWYTIRYSGMAGY